MKVLTIGSWAIPHIGHAAFLRKCELFGDLVVGVNSDAFIERYKGIRPIYTQGERMAIIAALGYQTVLNDGPGRDCIEENMPDIIAIGTDWATRDYRAQIDVTQEYLDERGISIVYIPARPVGISSTDIIRRIRESKGGEIVV